MTRIIFSGPSLAGLDRSQFADITFLPPAGQGDIYRSLQLKPQVIGLIDGYFDGVPSVWHKEILWALDAGVAVFGGASMGALRAAELHLFGMVGIGDIFVAYRDGELNDDDEVALTHGPAETGFIALSEPMVNVRATLQAAAKNGVLTSQSANQLCAIAKQQFYQVRSWDGLLVEARAFLPTDAMERFAVWLQDGKVDQKRIDALKLLDEVCRFDRAASADQGARFSFEYTQMWHSAPWRDEAAGISGNDTTILDELRLDPPAYEALRREALLFALACELEDGGEDRLSPAISGALQRTLRDRFHVRTKEEFVSRAKESATTVKELERTLADSAWIEEIACRRDAALHRFMIDRLKLQGRYLPLLKGAQQKRGDHTAAATKVRQALPPPLLAAWFFKERLNRDAPADLSAFAVTMGYSSAEKLIDLMAMEYASAQADLPPKDGTGSAGTADQENDDI